MVTGPTRRFAALALLGAIALPPAAAQEVPVDLELVLAVDVSGSMDPDERALQRDGYVAALRHPEVVAAIRSGIHGRIAVAYVEWAGPTSQAIAVPWRLIDGAETAAAVADELARAEHARIRGTSISGALTFASALFDGNGFEGIRRVVDVSGDGPNNRGLPVVPVRDAVIDRGIVINGLPITLRPGAGGGIGADLLDVYYQDCVIGGPGAFVVSVREPGQLGAAIRRKLLLEIAGRTPRVTPANLQAPAPRVDCRIGERNRPAWMEDGSR